MNFSSFYHLLYEDAESTKAQIFNSLIKKELGFQVFKFKNKPENADVINELRNKWNPIITQLENIILNINPKDKNLMDLVELVRLYEQNIPFNTIADDYKNYVKNNNLKRQNILKTSTTYTEFAEKVHSEMEEDTSKIKAGSSDDPNKVYEDDNIIVFLANTGDPVSSENNCKIYGKGSSLCISGSSSSHYYNYYRWENELTTYFVWLKDEKRYILIDAYEQNGGGVGYAYNNVKNNTDTKALREKIISIYPVLSNAFTENIFIPVPIQGKEKEIYEKLYHVRSINDLKSLEDKLLFASIKEVKNTSLYKLPQNELEPILKILSEKENDLPHELLDKFPAIKNRYWKKREINAIRELEEWTNEDDDEDFTLDEYFVISQSSELIDMLIQKIPKYRNYYNDLEKYNKKIVKGDITWDWKLPISLPKLQQSEYIYARTATSISLPNLQQSGNINAITATSISLPKLQQSKYIDVSNATSISLPNLERSGYINASNATSISLLRLAKIDGINKPEFTEIQYLDMSKELANVNVESFSDFFHNYYMVHYWKQ